MAADLGAEQLASAIALIEDELCADANTLPADRAEAYAVVLAAAKRALAEARKPASDAVLNEVARATAKFPTWPTDPLHALGVLMEEVGELSKAIVQQIYEPHKNEDGEVRKEAIQAAAMALRLVMSLDRYVFAPCEQHEQAAAPAGRDAADAQEGSTP